MFTFLNLWFLSCFNRSEFFSSYVYINTLQLKFQYNATCSRELRDIDSERPLRQISNKTSATLLSTNRIDDYIATKSRQNLKIKNEQVQKNRIEQLIRKRSKCITSNALKINRDKKH